MIIERVINNNIISTIESGSEVVICGKGIGFRKKPGDDVDTEKVEKIYRIENPERLGKFKDLLVKVPLECVRITDEIIVLAKKELAQELNENIYITLTDHITFALERYDKGMIFENALTQEVRSFYPLEFRIGLEAVKIIQSTTGKYLKDDEAASIALHIVSAELSTRTSVAFEITQAVKVIMQILKDRITGQDDRIRERLDDMIPMFKHFVFRIISDQQYENEDLALLQFTEEHYPTEYHCCEEIVEYMEEHFRKKITIDERSYIIIMLRKLNLKQNEK